jgi:hypothetical protein
VRCMGYTTKQPGAHTHIARPSRAQLPGRRAPPPCSGLVDLVGALAVALGGGQLLSQARCTTVAAAPWHRLHVEVGVTHNKTLNRSRT